MRLSLIGMSGSGKSYWSTKLEEELGFVRFCCDDLIEEHLGSELKLLGFSGLQSLAKWMGEPFDREYAVRSEYYLHMETEVMRRIIRSLQAEDIPGEKIVIDTTGSVIYTDDAILEDLTRLTRVVLLETPASVQEEMYRQYLDDPKPVIWGEAFDQKEGESRMDALRRCFPKLLEYRSKKYKKYGEVRIDHYALRTSGVSARDFLELISR